MQVPLELSVREVARTPELERLVQRQADRLERFSDAIVSCRVAVERPHAHPDDANPYRVRVEVTVPPRHELVVSKDPGDSDPDAELETVVRSAFFAIERQLKELMDRLAGDVKPRAEEARALVVRKFPDEGHGFLRAIADGREIYFHRNAVVGGVDFEELPIGAEVRFVESGGDKGPQASTVQPIETRGGRRDEEAGPAEPPRGWRS